MIRVCCSWEGGRTHYGRTTWKPAFISKLEKRSSANLLIQGGLLELSLFLTLSENSPCKEAQATFNLRAKEFGCAFGGRDSGEHGGP